ncbi:Catabolite control protein A [bioreactor metagenome]|jgi:LacI family transcriptional regulator|uniref:Catabolite control protein A n=1 Tax=bioreactor metagenome TaxID=1076179 RepID=A0A644TM28_9ZZZZ|nr:LacI family transcriptional regulator [Treponema sp.]VBB39133.1 Transcriptional regulator [uncultured Spirochaetota bacterium]
MKPNPRKERSTIRDIAALSGLSIASISRYFNGLKVRQTTAEKIEKALEQSDYAPNIAAKFMKGQRTGVIGLILPEISHPFFAMIAEGAIAEARENDQLILISSSKGSRENEKVAVEQFSRSVIDGLIYIPVSHPENIPSIESFRNIPLVVAGRIDVFPNIPHIYTDNNKGGYIATKYLIKQGRRDIGFFGSFWEAPCETRDIREVSLSTLAGTYSTVERFKGYLRALEEEGIPYNPDKIVLCGYGYANGYDAGRALMAKLSPIDGLLVMTSTVGSGAIEAFRDQGISVPENISVVVFDDDEIMNTSLPHLTSVQLSLRKMGIEAIRSLNKILAGEPCPNTVIDVRLKVGNSTTKKDPS